MVCKHVFQYALCKILIHKLSHMDRNCYEFILFLLYKLSVPHTNNVVTYVFLRKVASCFVMLVSVFVLLRSKVTQSPQNFYHLLFGYSAVFFSY